MSAVAFLLAAIAVAAIAGAYGFGAFARAWQHPHWPWLAVCVGAELLAPGAYTLAYHRLSRVEDGPRLSLPLAARLVVVGFGPHTATGGFSVDKRALHAIEGDSEAATVRVLGLGALEWALLAPAAWISAVVLLAIGDPRPMPSLLWPWAVAVPIGFAVGLWLATPERRQRLAAGRAAWRQWLAGGLRGVAMLPSLVSGFSSCWLVWVGGAAYWALDIAGFYAALRFVGLHLNAGEVIIAYATGYALTRRSMPLGGAGITETLMTFSLHWVGQAVTAALAAVVVYRVFNFVLPALPALLARRSVRPLLDAGEHGRASPAVGASVPGNQ